MSPGEFFRTLLDEGPGPMDGTARPSRRQSLLDRSVPQLSGLLVEGVSHQL